MSDNLSTLLIGLIVMITPIVLSAITMILAYTVCKVTDRRIEKMEERINECIRKNVQGAKQ